jgi:branched-subunit amino acid aminotransferase/4-amino-4-deoxychorismate lyase
VEELQREIQSYHIKFDKDMKKLEEIEGEVIENNDEQLMHLYFKVVEFFNEERMLFKENVPRNQFDVYATGYGIAYERIF